MRGTLGCQGPWAPGPCRGADRHRTLAVLRHPRCRLLRLQGVRAVLHELRAPRLETLNYPHARRPACSSRGAVGVRAWRSCDIEGKLTAQIGHVVVVMVGSPWWGSSVLHSAEHSAGTGQRWPTRADDGRVVRPIRAGQAGGSRPQPTAADGAGVSGGQGVAGSNPVSPTNEVEGHRRRRWPSVHASCPGRVNLALFLRGPVDDPGLGGPDETCHGVRSK